VYSNAGLPTRLFQVPQETQTTCRQLMPLRDVMGTRPNWRLTSRGLPVHAMQLGVPFYRQLPSVPIHATS
jgi:hypothetical protein